jgi:hypothetical protein
MEWKQTGDIYKAHVGEGYAIVKHERDGKQWFTIEYADQYIESGTYTRLDLAKQAAETHRKAYKLS